MNDKPFVIFYRENNYPEKIDIYDLEKFFVDNCHASQKKYSKTISIKELAELYIEHNRDIYDCGFSGSKFLSIEILKEGQHKYNIY